MVIVRFAPSPTGFLHIGGARTAIFNYLFARANKGKFYLRIEDTDIERSTKEYEEEILKSMKWLGMDYDGEPIYQTKRMDIYKNYIDKLIKSGNAYYCTCSKEELDIEREKATLEKRKPSYNRKCRDLNLKEGVVRFKAPIDGETLVNDMVLGKITVQNKELDDFIIARSDGTPTYNFTVVVDDHEMKITHIIRGDDHLNNTPKQILIYKALGINPPVFAHVPMILGPDKKKLSKRHGATSVSAYRKEGYLAEALFNYLVRLGWSHGDDEIFTKEKLIEIFNLESIGNSAAVLNIEKLVWLNAHYIKTLSPKEISNKLIEEDLVDEKVFDENVQKILPLVQERSKKLSDVAAGIKFIINEEVDISDEMKTKYLTNMKVIIDELIKELEKINFNDHTIIENIFKFLIEKHGIKMKNLAQAVRVLLTGSDISPSVFEVIVALGKERAIKRLSFLQ